MGDTTTKTRPETGGKSPSGSAKKETQVATNLLVVVVGKSGASSGRSGSGRSKGGKVDKKPVLSPKAHWIERIRLVTETIGFDIAALDQMPGTDVSVTSWKIQLEQATAPQKKGQWQESHRQLAKLQTELHDSVNRQRTEGLQALKSSAKERKEYEKLHAEIGEMQLRIKAYPEGSYTLDGNFALSLQRAEDLYDKNKFALAAAEVHEPHGLLKETLKTLDGQDSDARGVTSPLKDTYEALAKLNTLIGQKEEALGAPALQPYAARSTGIYKEMLAAMQGGTGRPLTKQRSEQSDTNKKLVERVAKLREDMLNATGEIDTKAQTAGKFVLALRKTISDGAEVRNQADVDKAYMALQEIENLIAARDFTTALARAGELGTEVSAWRKLPSDPQDRARTIRSLADTQFKAPAEEELARARLLAAAAASAPVLNTPPAASETVAMLEAQLRSYEEFPQAFPVSEGLEVLKRATLDNACNEKRKADYEKLTGERKRLDGEIATQKAAVTESLDRFKKIASAGGTEVKRLPAYEAERDAALELWQSESDRATAVEQLPAEAVKSMLKALREKIDTDATDPRKLAASGLESRLAELNERFETGGKRAKVTVEALGELDYEAGDAQASALSQAGARYAAAIKKHDPDAAQVALDAITKITDEARRSVEGMAGTLRKAKEAWMEMYGWVRDGLNGLHKAAQNKPLKDYATVVATMMSEHATIGTVHVSKDASVLKASVEDLRRLRGEILAVQNLFNKLGGKTKPDADDLTLDNFKARAKLLSKAFGKDKLVKEREAQGLTDITAKLATITDAIGTAKLAETDTQLTEIARAWAALQQTAVDHEAEINIFVLDVETTLAGFNKLEDARLFPDYAASVTKQLNALNAGATAGTVDHKALEELKLDIAKTTMHRASLERANARAQTEELQEQLAEKKWRSDYGAFQGKVSSLALVKKSITDPEKKAAFEEQLEQIEDAAKQVAKGAGKNPYASMCEQLQALVRNLNNLINYPMGLETHARGQILETVKDWNEAVTNFHKVIDRLTEEVGKAMIDDPRQDEIVKAVGARIASAKELLQANTIDPTARAVVKAGEDRDAARDAREQALREIKRLQRIVEGQALRPLGENKFQVPVLEALGNMSARLFNVETNLVISV